MPKPTRRERRKLAEKGKLAPRRSTANIPQRVTSTPMPRAQAPERRAALPTETASAIRSGTNEYAYVKADLRRILLLASTLVGAMVVLKFVLPQ